MTIETKRIISKKKLKIDIWYESLSVVFYFQMASYFGYTVAVSDVNNDGYVTKYIQLHWTFIEAMPDIY